MSPTAISPAWLVVAVVPVDAVVLVPELVAVLSSGVTDAPDRSSTVKAIADDAFTVTVTLPVVAIDAALAKYQISPSAWLPEVTAAAFIHTSPLESVTPVTAGLTLVLRARIVATRVSPVVVADVGDAESEVPAVALNAPNACNSVIDAPVSAGNCPGTLVSTSSAAPAVSTKAAAARVA